MVSNNASFLPKDLEAVYSNFISALEGLRQEMKTDPLPLFAATRAKGDDLDGITKATAKLREFDAVIILGTGGSSLGAQVLVQLAGWGTASGLADGPALHFLDNLSAYEMEAVLHAERLPKTAFVAVSKSGETAETLMQFSCALTALEAHNLSPADHMVCLTEDRPNTLRQLAEKYGMAVLDHNKQIGGRFSVLTNVGLLPAALAGLDVADVRAGAAEALSDFLTTDQPDTNPALSGAAAQIAHAKAGRQISVLMPYDSRLDKIGFWFRQLWAESLGKKGRGTTPVNALGPVDQHSQLQLYLDGPDDKFYTIIQTLNTPGPQAVSGIGGKDSLAWLHNRHMEDLVQAECAATYQALLDQNRPVRLVELGALTEKSLGGLLMNLMLETICAAHLLAVDAFDQPAVEQGKIIARQIMQDTR
ncbi:MAG: glucose-6-phosphate isomerase [Parvibaculales bacterium]